MIKFKISFHPYLAAGIELVASTLWWIAAKSDRPAIVFGGFMFWVVSTFLLTLFVYRGVPESAVRHAFPLLAGISGAFALVLVVDSKVSWWVVAFGSTLIAVLSFAVLPRHSTPLSFLFKAERRLRLLLGLMAVFGFTSGLLALFTFQVVSTAWLVPVVSVASIFLAYLAGWLWQEYGLNRQGARYRRALLAAALLFFELMILLWWWPIGYLASGFFFTWVWYLVWLLLRFYLSAEGIDWRRQRWFIGSNILLLAGYLLFIVRWK